MKTIAHVWFVVGLFAGFALGLSGCSSGHDLGPYSGDLIFSSTDRQLTGVAVSKRGRVFTNYPRWNEPYTNAVEEISPDKSSLAFPDATWNSWKPGEAPSSAFVCVQSVYVDDLDRLWILDPGSPQIAGVVPGAAKLVCVDLATNRVQRVYRFDDAIAPKKSYLNDVRIDTASGFAYLTDSGIGGIVVLNLAIGSAKRVLSAHPLTMGEKGVVPVVQGVSLIPNGAEPLVVNSDGIALSPNGQYLYFQALTARTLYRVPTEYLRGSYSDAQVAERVENLGRTVVTDGIEVDTLGNVYFSALEHDAVIVRTPAGTMDTLVESEKLSWPDSFAWADFGGSLYVTTSRIHRSAWFDKVPRIDGMSKTETPAPKSRGPFEIYRIQTEGYCGGVR
ncbi:MAG: SMP-30/gluconolactonase/LRE family protein [Phycisphaerales bacterium]|nr:SMP-30/gluconolactonase/LRE family protein [Phycisphaerales bacterium]